MAKMSKFLKVSKVKHPNLGEIVELYSPCAADGTAAYYLDVQTVTQRNREGRPYHEEIELGMGLRLTKKTALKLADALKKLAKELK